MLACERWPAQAAGRLVGWLRSALTEPELDGVNPDSPAFTRAHRMVMERKVLVRQLFTEFARRCLDADRVYFSECPAGLRVEIGSGAGLMKRVDPTVLASDVKFVPSIDLALRGEELPFKPGTVRAIFAINVFHHVPDPRDFFREMDRMIAPGGGLVMIEPYYGPVARLIFKRLFTMESYDIGVPDWPRHGRSQVASEANQALAYVVLARDRDRWEREFPSLEVAASEPHTHLKYVLSGGVNFRQLVPTEVGRALGELENHLPVLNPLLALQHTVVIRKKLR